MAFEVAVYTDVVASEAIDGVDGFNFQAVSPGLTGVDQQRIRQNLLHRVIPAWSLAHDELSHPPTCAYVVRDGRSYLARGKSTGTTNSGRPGNQLTQAIATSDPDDFVPYRPAQLYGAVAWTLAKARLQVERWVTPLEICPEFQVAALEELITGDKWASEILPHYLTMLDQAVAAEPKKLVLLHTDLDLVMRWIALGTLFVEAEAARVLQFRALVDDPWLADAAVVGVSPDFGVADLGAANVLDLAQRTVPSIVPSDVSRVRAAWFLQQGADDALSAIEIARRWESTLGADLANDAARVVGMPDSESAGPVAWRIAFAAIDQLAAAGLREDLTLYADELCEATLAYGPTSEDEFRLAGRAIRRAHDACLDEVASGVVVPTLEALASVPAVSGGFAEELSGAEVPIRWESADAQEAAGAFMGEVLRGTPAGALPEVFAAAWVVGSVVPESSLTPAVANLSALWLRDPALGQGRWRRWLAGHAVVAATGRQVLNAFRVGDEQALTDLLRGDWDFIGEHADDRELVGWLKAGQLGRIPVQERKDRIALAADVPSDAWRVVLAGSALPRHAKLWASWITQHGLPVDLAAVIRFALDEALDGVPGGSETTDATDWSPIMERLIGAPDPELAHLAGSYARSQTAFRTARSRVRARPSTPLDPCLPYIRAFARLFLADVGWLMLNSTNPDEVEKILDAASPWGAEAVRASILDLAMTGQGLGAIEHALRTRSQGDEALAAAADDALAEILDTQPELAARARIHPRIRGDLEKYVRQRARSQGSKRRLGVPFGRSREN